jgi:hypothetical protein
MKSLFIPIVASVLAGGEGGNIYCILHMDPPQIPVEVGDVVTAQWEAFNFCPSTDNSSITLPDGTEVPLVFECGTDNDFSQVVEYTITQEDAEVGSAIWTGNVYSEGFNHGCGLGWGVNVVQPLVVDCVDINGDGSNSVEDLLFVITNWGPCSGEPGCFADVNCDGAVDVTDLIYVICLDCPEDGCD